MNKFTIKLISATESPQKVIWTAMHQDYSEDFVHDKIDLFPSETKAGELVVKHLLSGNKGHYGCYSADTEVLTDRGWMLWTSVWAEWNKNTCPKLLAVNIENNECHFETPQAVQAVNFTQGDRLYTLESQYLNFAVTHDHRMVVSRRTKSGKFTSWYFQQADKCHGSPVRYLLNSCLKNEDRCLPEGMPSDVDTITAFKLAGFFFGDGMRTQNKIPQCIRFRIRRPRKIAYLLSLGLTTDELLNDHYTIRHVELAQWLHRNFTSETGKTIPLWILKLPKQELAAFWDGLKNSDGTRITEKSWAYDSVEKQSLDLIQAVAHINGFSANMILNNPNEGIGHENHRPCWRLRISEHSTRRVETCQKSRSPGVTESWTEYQGKVYCATVSTGALMVRRKNKVMVSGNCLEHPQITVNVGYFPHSLMQQIRTHRVGVSFDVQSFRYTGKRILEVAENTRNVEEVFYIRPSGEYTDRQGKKYYYLEEQREEDLNWCIESAKLYCKRIKEGVSEEHARAIIPFDTRQHFIMSCNMRSLMHLLDLRWKKDAQLEAQIFSEHLFGLFEIWSPEIAKWYFEHRAKKARLSP